ncbi:molybdopterin-guanine dinucleotide biosynthesis protein B [Eubacterium sp. 1001713B170207_170306_E7]|uniref:molybdopterin-guanine dinucleotide biosynthesis protein B n=1 Tax=Eubacterium sp. 1001713B170207_170306_E7 TaxID=2787097 RepID=UPI0018972FDD|nr:molybdopterin-guanine dinucleotide biosynthesis protein B [Eubacterium sp. 1001713B170207_170306_E7]
MKVISICGISDSGKTTTAEHIIKELRRRGYSVGSVKEIHYDQFKIDTEGSNTDRHRKAGSQLVTARGKRETDILFQEKLPIREILAFYAFDYVVLEGVADACVPMILTAHRAPELEERWNDYVLCCAGRIAGALDTYRDRPVFDARTQTEALVDLIELKTYHILPDFDKNCCDACGYGCAGLGPAILRGEAREEDCIVRTRPEVNVKINGQPLEMVLFVQNIIRSAVTGIVGELKGYEKGAAIEISIGKKQNI